VNSMSRGKRNRGAGFLIARGSTQGIKQALLILMAFTTIYPVYYVIVNSFKTRVAYAQSQISLPREIVLYNFMQVFNAPNFLRWFGNTVLLAGGAVLVTLVAGSLAAYALSRMKFVGRRLLHNFIISLMVVPPIVMMIPLFVLMSRVGLVNTYPAVIIIYAGMLLPFSIYLLRSFFITIPQAMLDSARVDGCGSFGILRRILVPLSKPVLFALLVVCTLWVWNELLIALIFLQKEYLRTIMVGLTLLKGRFSVNVPLLMAGMSTAIVPMIVLYVFCQKYLVRGLIAGSLKE
jgi:ABC-type glycerol-3-phosphate transport system permease component